MTAISLDVANASEELLRHAPLFMAIQKTLQYIEVNGPIGLTPTKALKRYFVHWAAKEFDWPHLGYDELFCVRKTLHEFDFEPLEMVHYIICTAGFARHYKGALHLTKKGKKVLLDPQNLFTLTVPFYLFHIDHATWHWNREEPAGNWGAWLNVISIMLNQHGCATDMYLYEQFYGPFDPVTQRSELRDFVFCVLKPLTWVGLLAETREGARLAETHYYAKTPLWITALQLESDHMLTKPIIN